MILEYNVTKKDINKTINQIINEKFDLSNRLFNKLIKNKQIFINNKNVDTRLMPNIEDQIIIDLNYIEDNSNIISKKMNLNILYEDDSMLIINKPSGIAVHPSINHYEDSIASGIKYYFESIGINKKIRPVNRLDLNTSGVIVFAKNEYVQECLIKQMKTNKFIKQYIAVVEGILKNKKGIINKPIARKENSIIERCVSKDGQMAITEYEVIKEYSNNSLVKCKLLTGRTHQIRVHMAYIGHPLLGDSLYGNKSKIIDGQVLHCYRLAFLHPVTRKNIEITSDWEHEQKFEKILEKLLTK